MFELSDLKQTRVYQEALAEGEEQGLERGLQEGERLVVENLLRVRFGELDPPLQAIISRILQLSPEEFTPLLLQCSKQELLKQFSPEKSRGN
jgi:predicted transposase YdaD